VVDFGNIPFALFRLQEQIVLLKAARTSHEDVIQVYEDFATDDEIMEDLVHHCLESCGRIGEAEEHYQGFVQSPVSHEGRFPFITGLDLDIVVSPL
ncbi:hypothetical protein POSPLADRAFT_1122462, partial [Postia placenta MAD-698-R-SB12]